jgi:hypothetical protein
MPFCAWYLGSLRHRLLDPILPEVDCARLHRHPNNLGGKLLADRNQGYRLWIATDTYRGRCNALPHASQSVNDFRDQG